MASMVSRVFGLLSRAISRYRCARSRRVSSAETLARIHEIIAQYSSQGAAARAWLSAGLDVRVDEIDTEVDTTATPSRRSGSQRTDSKHAGVVARPSTWARRMVISARGAPRAMIVVILHRQALEFSDTDDGAVVRVASGVPCATDLGGARGSFPVIILAGHMGPDDDRRILAIPDAENYLPRLTCAPDGRIVVDRSAPQYRPEFARQMDDLDAVVAGICRDPMVATLLQDWVSETSHR